MTEDKLCFEEEVLEICREAVRQVSAEDSEITMDTVCRGVGRISDGIERRGTYQGFDIGYAEIDRQIRKENGIEVTKE